MDFKNSKTNNKIDLWITVSLLSILFLGINFLVHKINFNVDITPNSIHSLSFETTEKLKELSSSINIFVTIPQNTNQPKIIQKLVHDFKIIGEAFQNLNLKHNINVHYVNIDTIHNSTDIINKNKITERNAIIVTSENGEKKYYLSTTHKST